MTEAIVAEYGLPINANKTSTSYNEPGLPTPPAGWGRVVGIVDTFDADDEGPESRDEEFYLRIKG